jgi:hypothetical protein
VTTTAPATTTTTTTVPGPLAFNYTVAGQFVGPVVAGGTAGLQVQLSVANPPGGPGASRLGRMFRLAAITPTEVRLTLPVGVTFAAIDAGWDCTQTDGEAVCTSPSLETPGNLSILVRMGVGSTLNGSVSIGYEIVAPDGRHITGVPAVATVTSAAP